MKLDRGTNINKQGKYAAVNMRRVRDIMHGPRSHEEKQKIKSALALLEKEAVLSYGLPFTYGEFFLIMLKDECAYPALIAYALKVQEFDKEYAEDIRQLAERAGINNPWCKRPD